MCIGLFNTVEQVNSLLILIRVTLIAWLRVILLLCDGGDSLGMIASPTPADSVIIHVFLRFEFKQLNIITV